MHLTFRSLIALCSLLMAPFAHGHAGAVGADGCHADTARGKRHCHPERKSSRAQSSMPQFSAARPPRPGDEGVFFGPLVSIKDGDTFQVRVQGVVMDFRLAGIDAPERDQPYGAEAKQALATLIGKRQCVVVPIDTDRYGRTVAFLWIGDTYVNREMVMRGAAWFYSEFASDAQLFDVEQRARAERRGLWALPLKQRVEPWIWRRDQRS